MKTLIKEDQIRDIRRNTMLQSLKILFIKKQNKKLQLLIHH